MTGSPSNSPEPEEHPRTIQAGRRVIGRLRVPSSKSVTHRALNLALLSGRPWTVAYPLLAEDTRLFLAALERCGFRVEERPVLTGAEVDLTPGEAPVVNAEGEVEIFCGNAGTMLRFLVATLAVLPGRWCLDGVPRLRERPVGPLVEALRGLGARIDCLERDGFVPLRIAGGTMGGGTTAIDAGESSQYLSALLMAALRAPEPVTIEVAALTSEPYVDITLGLIRERGGRVERIEPEGGRAAYRVWPSELRGGPIEIEGDFSAACYPAAAAALTGGAVVLEGLRRDSRQGDAGFLDLLVRMGAQVSWQGGMLAVMRDPRPGHFLRGIEADLSGMPDQVPTLAALAPFARGETHIRNVAHLRIKESDRLAAMATELRRIGATVEEGPDFLKIQGTWTEGPLPDDPVTVETYGDHRIAMSLAVAGLVRPGVTISSPGVVAKSYPRFWDDLAHLIPS